MHRESLTRMQIELKQDVAEDRRQIKDTYALVMLRIIIYLATMGSVVLPILNHFVFTGQERQINLRNCTTAWSTPAGFGPNQVVFQPGGIYRPGPGTDFLIRPLTHSPWNDRLAQICR